MPRNKPPYPPEFRREAVELARSSGGPIAQVARDLGVSGQTLHTWIKQADVDAGEAGAHGGRGAIGEFAAQLLPGEVASDVPAVPRRF